MLCTPICDAVLGALALGDIGAHFPDTDARWKDADSRVLLRHVAALMRADGLAVANLDTTVIAQAPKLAPHVPAMRANIAQDLGCDVDAGQRQGDHDRAPRIRGTRGGHRRAGDRPSQLRLVVASLRETGIATRGDVAAAVARQELERPAVHARDALDDREAEARAGSAARVACAPPIARVNGCFRRSTSAGSIPGPRSATSSTNSPPALRRRHLDRRRAVGERVVDEVGDEARERSRAQRHAAARLPGGNLSIVLAARA